jgi:AraC-like DNA-binding protein
MRDILRERLLELNRVPLRVQLGSFTAEIITWGYLGSTWWRNYMHEHTHFEICHAFAGRGLFRMLGVDYAVLAGQVFIAKPGEEHEIIADEKDPLGIHFWSFTLVKKPGAVANASDEATDRLLHRFIDSTVWVSDDAAAIGMTLELLTEEIVRMQPGYLAAIEGLTRKLILDTARAGVGKDMPGESVPERAVVGVHAIVAQAKRYMHDNIGRDLSVRDIAAQVNFSERHLSRVFRQQVKKAPLEYLVEARVELAGQLLLDQSLAIKDIARRVGYADVRYFTTVFRRMTGLPPATYRAQQGTKMRDPAAKRGEPKRGKGKPR